MADRATRTPTAEQQTAMDLFDQGRSNLVIEAGAGTGKTTTLGMIARTTTRTGGYLAFNRSIAADAGRAMPMTVEARTVHSYAARALRQTPNGSALLDRLGGARMAPYKMAKHLGLGPIIITIPTEGKPRQKVLQPAWQASHVLRGIAQFCQSADAVPTREHFPYVEGIDPIREDGRRSYSNNRQVARELEPYLAKAWADLTSPTGVLRFTHDVYLKMAALAEVQIPGDFLLFDEAQDASPVMLGWLASQGRPIVYVGDSQQQIYGWRGAINALNLVPDGTPRAYLTQSWRFGPDAAALANLILDQLDATLRLTGTESIPTRVHVTNSGPPPRAVLCRSNGMAVNAVLQVQAQGLQPHLVGGADEIVRFARAAGQLQAGERTTHPELACFESWREVVDYVDNDPGGSDLAMLVKMLTKYGVQIVVDALDGLLGEDAADVVISTAHKAKGREWENVRLAPDVDARPGQALDDGEWRLLYVAATRATHSLDISSCLPLRGLYPDDLAPALAAGPAELAP
jgi:hypothetical protein